MKKITIMLTLLCTMAFTQEKGTLTDPRDKKTYKTVKIGTQTWMAENLNYNANGSKCYDNKPANCQKYGRLYNWNTAMKACPRGWHLPSDEEWGDFSNCETNTQGGLEIYGVSSMGVHSISNSGETGTEVSRGTSGKIGNALGNLMGEDMQKHIQKKRGR
jgi:uncharacterized protein (TIGR02145 family)